MCTDYLPLLSEFLHRGMLATLRNITSSIHYVIHSGDFSLRIPESTTSEFQLFSDDLNSLLREMQSLKASLMRDNRSLAAKALEDPLTGLANRSAFAAHLRGFSTSNMLRSVLPYSFLMAIALKASTITGAMPPGMRY